MLMQLGQFTFGLQSLPFEQMQRQMSWRHAENARIGAAPGVQFLGPDAEKLTITGAVVPEIGSRSALQQLHDMAAEGAAYSLTSGAGEVFGAYVIESIEHTGTHFVAEGVPRKTGFTLQLKRVGDASQIDPAGGADDGGGMGAGGQGFDSWGWWLGLW